MVWREPVEQFIAVELTFVSQALSGKRPNFDHELFGFDIDMFNTVTDVPRRRRP